MGREKAAPKEPDSGLANHLPPTSRLGSDVAVDFCGHLGPPEINRPSAAQRRGVLDEDDLFVVTQAMEDLLGLDQAAGDLLAAGGLMGRPAVVLSAGGGAGAFGDRITERSEFTAGLR